jgi:acylphosphatase
VRPLAISAAAGYRHSMTPGPHHYSTDVEGGARVQVRYAIEGRIEPVSYLAFVAERARWLDVRGWGRWLGDGRIEVVAAGPEALVGALEMACTLGPLDALVERIEGTPMGGVVAAGFWVR